MKPVLDYYRCPENYVGFDVSATLSCGAEFFQFGPDITCYGKHAESRTAAAGDGIVHGGLKDLSDATNGTRLLFDPAEVVENLRFERYVNGKSHHVHPLRSSFASIYYFLRPVLPIPLRKHLQRLRLRDWSKLQFPKWPVDRTVDKILERLLLVSLASRGVSRIPFIWFWPDGASSCAIMTHDVETTTGRDYCKSLMDIDARFDIPASFQIIPERRYSVPASYLAGIRDRGFEINVQDLNHDGFLYRSHDEFLRRVDKINSYGRLFGAAGFRSGALYRRQEWYGALRFEYDMSVPNVAHLDTAEGWLLHSDAILRWEHFGTACHNNSGLFALPYPENVFAGSVAATDRSHYRTAWPYKLHCSPGLCAGWSGTAGLQGVALLLGASAH